MRIEKLKEKLRKQKEQLTLIDQQRVFIMGTIAILEDLVGTGRRDKRDPKAKVEEEGPQPASNNSVRA